MPKSNSQVWLVVYLFSEKAQITAQFWEKHPVVKHLKTWREVYIKGDSCFVVLAIISGSYNDIYLTNFITETWRYYNLKKRLPWGPPVHS